MTRTLYLHMGHAKTGSSWIQTSLRMSQDTLSTHGICYAPGDRLPTDADHRITSGNGRGFLDSQQSMTSRLGRGDIPPDASILFSHEDWGHDLDQRVSDYLPKVALQHGFMRVSVLLFIRDPLAHASSVWQQDVKGGGQHHGIDEYFREYLDYTEKYAHPQQYRSHPSRRWLGAMASKSESGTTLDARDGCWRRQPHGWAWPMMPSSGRPLSVSTVL